VTVQRCAWCGEPFAVAGGPGRPARYCRRSHRQRHYEARREADRLGIEGVLISGSDWLSLRDALYRLETAFEDADHDLADGGDPRTVLDEVRRAAAEALDAMPEPTATAFG
jgi:DNA-directed RNA polymerase specialized sigma24 family protein